MRKSLEAGGTDCGRSFWWPAVVERALDRNCWQMGLCSLIWETRGLDSGDRSWRVRTRGWWSLARLWQTSHVWPESARALLRAETSVLLSVGKLTQPVLGDPPPEHPGLGAGGKPLWSIKLEPNRGETDRGQGTAEAESKRRVMRFLETHFPVDPLLWAKGWSQEEYRK